MRLVWLLALAVLVGGCATPEPAPPPGDDGGEGAGNETPTNDTREDTRGMRLHSPAFADGDPIPAEHSKEEGDNTSPPLTITDVPDGTASFALIVDDPDAPTEEPFVHWLIWNIPNQADTIAEGYPPSGDGQAFNETRQGTNGFGNQRYDGPAPPPGDDPHRYRFQLFALEHLLGVEEGAHREELEAAMEGAVVADAELVGTYER